MKFKIFQNFSLCYPPTKFTLRSSGKQTSDYEPILAIETHYNLGFKKEIKDETNAFESPKYSDLDASKLLFGLLCQSYLSDNYKVNFVTFFFFYFLCEVFGLQVRVTGFLIGVQF